MKKNSIYVLMSAIALAGSVGFSSCSSEDDVIDKSQQLIHLVQNERRREHVRLAAEVVMPVLRLEKRTRRGSREILCAKRIDGRTGERLLRKQYLHARTIRDAFQHLEIAHQRRLVDDVAWCLHHVISW